MLDVLSDINKSFVVAVVDVNNLYIKLLLKAAIGIWYKWYMFHSTAFEVEDSACPSTDCFQ